MSNIPKNKTERLTAVLQDLGFWLNQNDSVYLEKSVINQKIGKAFPKPRKATKRYEQYERRIGEFKYLTKL